MPIPKHKAARMSILAEPLPLVTDNLLTISASCDCEPEGPWERFRPEGFDFAFDFDVDELDARSERASPACRPF
jgi:hypothetical protein